MALQNSVYMNGANTEVEETTISAPRMMRKITMGRSHHLFFTAKYEKIARIRLNMSKYNFEL